MTIRKTTDHASKVIDGARNVRCFALSNNFSGEPLAEKPLILGEMNPGDTHRPLIAVAQQGFLRHELRTKTTKLTDSGHGRYTVHVHSNLWYTFESGMQTMDSPLGLVKRSA
jgi:hypothetical protein